MIGRKLRNRYEIREHLGDGSTATVYKAHDERLGRDVAIKMLLPHVRDTTRKRFQQEANAAAQLNHPNIMAMFDIDEENERLYLVLEYVEGVSLSHYVPASPETVVKLGVQIANALQYAHDREIIHRDIKPANIKVTAQGQVKLMDLGLALPREAVRVTQAGMVIGTPAYLSPEQAKGEKLDLRTDIYSLGIVLYEMATGQLPFNADDIGALLLQQVKQSPPPPRLLNAAIPVELEAVILKALEKNPARRYQSAGALAEALEASLLSAPAGDHAAPPAIDDAIGRPRPAEEAGDTMVATSPRDNPRRARRTLRIILADDHTLLRKTLSNMLETRDDFVIVAEAGDGDSALKQTLAILPDLLILDLNMPLRTGIDILPEIRAKAPTVRVLILTGRDEEVYIVRALRAGAHGYVLKSADEAELLEAIDRVVKGQLYLGRGVTEKVTGLLTGATDDARLDELECRIMLYVAAGFDNDAITRRLKMPITEVIETLARSMDKLRAKDRHAAALKALREGYVLLEDLQALSEAAE
jgi:DNA-binding NarL/FixJ family response regulator/tRNA A-37 threonylcarbamoyl transferase component Bud32